MEMLAATVWVALRPTPSLLPSPSLEQLTDLRMPGGVAGVPLPVQGSGGKQLFSCPSSLCGRKPETQTGMREGLVTGARRADLGA